MRVGSKKIYHLEAWVVKVMSIYKVCLHSLCFLTTFNIYGSTSSMIWTWQCSTTDFVVLWFYIRCFLCILFFWCINLVGTSSVSSCVSNGRH